ncbi:3-deoxy-D-manno-octulosonic acid transferase [Fulvivirga sedimenti]|uniref:3-deoxy-D-manno-octulosonic acid transferase n=1 Tax=Fulvivirga sedimenti TaxID=2879465 RepID=A0A9X1HWE3_9BACT|nr:glycosyltransferase N-terminal domain-containing protein [Fulvivirga sedimenti]MCA6078012.1 3-deoxy-D-manno-octulosonic acid transferase [Fulvivirga sedimenti]
MGKIVYRFFLLLYRTAIKLAAPFNSKARLFRDGRQKIWEQAAAVNPSQKPLLWVHCASLGEFEQGRPLIEKYRLEYPEHLILITFFSPSGYEVRKNYSGADAILYLPLDGKKNAQRFIDLIKPTLAFFIKYEFWHYYLRTLNRHKIPVLSISAIFRKDQIYFQPWGGFQRASLRFITHFFVQDRESASLLSEIGLTNVSVSGDTRFDRVFEISREARDLPEIRSFLGEKPAFIIGSAWPADLDVMIPFMNEHDLKYIIAPHEISDRFLAEIESDLEKKCIRHSRWTKAQEGEFDILIIDNVGMLAHLYQYGKFAWVGGAYGQGLHNILEAAVFGLPVFFGNKNYTKFREARDLINLGGAFAVANYVELREHYTRLEIENSYLIVKETNEQYIQSQLGATKEIITYTKELLNHDRSRS